jgi:O-antigen ligase
MSEPGLSRQAFLTVPRIALFLACHVGLALMVSRAPILTSVQAGLTLVFGLYWTQLGRRADRVVYVCAYITSSEVMWRMTDAWVFWESGKYFITLFCLLGLIRQRNKKVPPLPVLYFLLLLPSVVLSMMTSPSPALLRQQLSFNLSGPLALAAGVCFFSNVHISKLQLQRVFLSLTGPAISIAVMALIHFSKLEKVYFSQSNTDTSGGFGPNQVSSVLGLGAFFSIAFVIFGKEKMASVAVMLAAGSFLAFQSALTFSRGGLYSALLALAVAVLFLLGSSKHRARTTLLAAVTIMLAVLVVIPKLQLITGGAFSNRFESLNTTKRDVLVDSDLSIWLEHPLLGVGPGMVPDARAGDYHGLAHTEFSRLLAEHGCLGGLALLLLLAMGLKRFRDSTDPFSKAVAASMLVWSSSFMFHAAMRLAAPSFIFALGCIGLQSQPHFQLVSIKNRTYRLFLLGRKLLISDGKDARLVDLNALASTARLASRRQSSHTR